MGIHAATLTQASSTQDQMTRPTVSPIHESVSVVVMIADRVVQYLHVESEWPSNSQVKYILRQEAANAKYPMCLHNWSDDHSARILRSLVPALRPGIKVLIWDSVLSDRPVKKLSERFNLQQSFIMATISNGKNRSVDEFRRVLEMSDERFKIKNIVRPKRCQLTTIAVWWDV